jgi:hypothetical protein
MEAPMLYTFDTSRTLNLALVATQDLSDPQYVPLSGAPTDLRAIALPYLRQLHTIANTELCGLIARQRSPLNPADWDVLSGERPA